MFSTLLMAAALTLGQDGGKGGKLEITNVRPTYGHLGAVRPKGAGILPGDVINVTFDINNLKQDPAGKALYSVAIEIRDQDGELVYSQQPQNQVAQNFFGGNAMPSSASIEVPLDSKPGARTYKVTVHDRNADQTAVLQGKGNVLKPDFGIIRVGTYADAQGRVPQPPVGVVGETLYVSFAAVGFGRDKNTQQPDLKVKMRILDSSGKATTPQPLAGHINKDIPASLGMIPLQFALAMNREGRYTVELTARCEMCDKTATVTFPVRILPME
jgi:hypothetical protein